MSQNYTKNPWTQRYLEVASIDEIRRRTRVDGKPVEGLCTDPIEVACIRLANGMKSIFVPTIRCCEIILAEVERALAHAQIAYPDERSVMQSMYGDIPNIEIDQYSPTCLTGPSGTGKTELVRAIGRLLKEIGRVKVDAAHGDFPLHSYFRISMYGKKSISGALRPLARPEIAAGKVYIKEEDLPTECSQWQYISGLSLFGVDELQFMTQSQNASVLISKTLLAFADIRIPWHFVANYSLIWRLSRRPHEITQRVLSGPQLLLPDRPDSSDWSEVLAQCQIVVSTVFSFKLTDHAIDLWNFCAGLKRELVKLLVIAYRICRHRQANKVEWSDVKSAYSSGEFMFSRRDIELLISHAGQGGDLREDLLCPFVEAAIATSMENYKRDLQSARASDVATAAADSSLNVEERKIISGLRARTEPPMIDQPGKAAKKQRSKRRSLEALQQAGREFNQDLKKPTDTS